MKELSNSFLDACRVCLSGIDKDGNFDFPHSLPICIMDAVFSIGIRYEQACKSWQKYQSFFGIIDGRLGCKEHTISDFLNNVKMLNGVEAFRKKIGISKHRTSSRNGILKIEAVVQIAEILRINGIETIDDFRNYPNKQKLDSQILEIRGQSSGIMLKYLYMLAGSTDECKPDRWLLRFAQSYYSSIKLEEISELLKKTVEELKPDYPSLTVRMLDNAIWQYMKNNSRKKR